MSEPVRVPVELTTKAAVTTPPILVFDLDGTVSVGEGPVLAYGENSFARQPPAVRTELMAGLRRYLDRLSGHGEPLGPDDPADGYAAVRALNAATENPADRKTLSAAYLASRRSIASRGLGVRPADGVIDLLAGLAGHATRVLLTNSPALGMAELLERLAVRDLFDQVVVGAGKPSRLTGHLSALLGPAPARDLMSIGDNWANDLAGARTRGCATAFIGPVAPRGDQPVDLYGRDFVELAEPLLEWVARRSRPHTPPA